MNTTKIIAVAALSLAAVAGAQAETYQGVHPLVSANSRDAVRAEAVVAAHQADPYATGAQAGLPAVFTSQLARAYVRAEAVAAARLADPYSDAAMARSTPRVTVGLVDRATVRAEARAAARSGNTLL